MENKYPDNYPDAFKEYYTYIYHAGANGVKVKSFIDFWYPYGEEDLSDMQEAGLIYIKDGMVFNNVTHPDDVIIMSCARHGRLTKKDVRPVKSYRIGVEHYKACRICANESVEKYRNLNKDKIKARRQALQEKLKQKPNRILSEIDKLISARLVELDAEMANIHQDWQPAKERYEELMTLKDKIKELRNDKNR